MAGIARGDVAPHTDSLLAGSSDQSPGSRVSISLLGTSSSFQAGPGLLNNDVCENWLQQEEFTNSELLCMELPKERMNMSADEFIEAIPYDETRGYTKRVLSTYFTYTWLAAKTNKLDDRVPPLPNTF